MSPKDIYFYFGEYRGSKWSHVCLSDYERLVRLVAFGVLSFGLSKDHFFKLLEKDITQTIEYLKTPSPEGEKIQVCKSSEPV